MVVVAAVDRSDRAGRVITEAVALGGAFGEPVHVLHSMKRSTFVDLGVRTAEDGDPVTLDDVRAYGRKVAKDAMEAAGIDADDADGEGDDLPPIERVGLVGDPEEEIVKYAEREDARYIIVLGRKQSPTAKAIFGSVAQSVLLNAPCSVVAPPRALPE
ncbi:universal stress protein [Halorubrum vacuolatum]|uniref:Nucleotide-binding universal stress protein, UspA family n=1 Tax=Halorubrum vacuolatum TaxID=63740 RepID=A0A238UQ74_HALVU|nr:universal stress protein [Halorubrum vacuolatum]SNR23449.1 Nucleotide-binding universal stress protein, UspA family [Halorubrum vacuolatum]